MIYYIDSKAKPSLPLEKFKIRPARVLIYGAGSVGKMLLEQVKQSSDLEFLGFVDRDINKCAISERVFRPADIATLPFDYILIASYRYRNEICKILHKYPIDLSKIITLRKEDFICDSSSEKNTYLTTYPILPMDRIPCHFKSEKLKVLIFRGGGGCNCV